MILNADQFEQWVFFLSPADRYEPAQLRQILPEATFQKATGVLEMISHSDELRLIYDDHANAAKNQFSALKEARAEGEYIGRILTLQQILGDEESDPSRFALPSLDELQALAESHLQRLQGRP